MNIDLYCERVGQGLWAEPFNVLTNIAYVVVAWVLVRAAARAGRRDRQVQVLARLPLAIAAGSTLFHVFATSWARRFDEAPILVFEVLFLWIYARRGWKWEPARVAIGLAAFVAAVGAGKLVDVMNGSVSYLPPLALGLLIGVDAWRTERRVDLLAGAGLFAIAIGCRVIDLSVCGALPIGTHFLWHLTTAVVLYLFGRAGIDAVSRAGRAGAATRASDA